MSANNMLSIRRKEDKWIVVELNAEGVGLPMIRKEFKTRDEAIDYAVKLLRDEIIEYGINNIDKKED